MTTWRKELEAVDAFPLVGCTLTEAELDVEFDGGYGCREGSIFTAWSATRVFFPVSYDGSEWVGSAPRDPCDESTEHQGE